MDDFANVGDFVMDDIFETGEFRADLLFVEEFVLKVVTGHFCYGILEI